MEINFSKHIDYFYVFSHQIPKFLQSIDEISLLVSKVLSQKLTIRKILNVASSIFTVRDYFQNCQKS